MNCAEANETLLGADLEELEGKGETALALHLSACPACRAGARAILRGEAELAEALIHHLSTPNLDEVLRQAGEVQLVDGEAEVVGSLPGLRPWPAGILIPLAAAAALALLFLPQTRPLPGPEYHPIHEEEGLRVEAPQGQSVAVLRTNNPDISVVWLFQE